MDTVVFYLLAIYFTLDVTLMLWRAFGGQFKDERVGVETLVVGVVLTLLQIAGMYALCSHSEYGYAGLWFGIFIVIQIIMLSIAAVAFQIGRLLGGTVYSLTGAATSAVCLIMTFVVYQGI